MHVLNSLLSLIIAFALIHPAVAQDAEPSAAFSKEPSAAFSKEPSAATSNETRARQVIKEMEQLYRGESSRSTITMKVETPHYQRLLKMEGQSLGQDFAFFRFLSPKKDRGIATLKRDQEMWNYFPKINKVIKVPPSMMMGSWMGSDFTNDDLVKETTLIDAYHLS
ncbi:MAG: outer membrane lipoprotein-sorting protein, partial [Gammaproteobacteria bacterium]|nr:outer membrane lipoprotein-sorting protein [Gammaproteobacteria bacterium]